MRRTSGRAAPKLILLFINVIVLVALPLTYLPVAAHLEEIAQFGQVAVAQSIGRFLSIVGSLGYAISGPALIAPVGRTDAGRIFKESVCARLMVTIPLATMGIVGLALLKNLEAINLAALIAASSYGLSASWFSVGRAAIWQLVVLDTLPRLSLFILGVLLSIEYGGLGYLVAAEMIGSLLAAILGFLYIRCKYRGNLTNGYRAVVTSALLQQKNAVGIAVVAGAYVALPLPLVSGLGGSGVPLFAALLRLAAVMTALVQPLTQILQGYVPSGSPSTLALRVRRATRWALGCAVVAGMLTYAVSARVVFQASDGTLAVTTEQAILVGCIVALIAFSQILGLACMTALHMTQSVLRSTLLAAVVGIGLMPVLYIVEGVTGALAALAAAELSVCIYQVVATNRRLSSLR